MHGTEGKRVIRLVILFWIAGVLSGIAVAIDDKPLDRSSYFAFVDRDYIFTIEMVSPGVPVLNFVSMGDRDSPLPAKNIQLTIEGRKVAAKFFWIDTGDPKEPAITPSLRMRTKTSFGARLKGEFGEAKEMEGAVIRIEEDSFSLVALNSLAFENLVLKVNRLNLGSPDLTDDWRVLKLEAVGKRDRTRKRS